MEGAGLFFLLLLLLVILPVAGWIGYTRWRAHKQGLPPPPLSAYNPFKRSVPNPFVDSRRSGPIGWVKDKLSGIRGAPSSGGAYHGAAHSRLDPDGAWDVRVGDEADHFGPGGDYEEQELGLHPSASGHYAGGGYRQALPQYGEQRGRARSREDGFVGGNQEGLDQRYDEEMHGADPDPFGNTAERSNLRGISPRPMDDQPNHSHKVSKDAGGERRSVFHETL